MKEARGEHSEAVIDRENSFPPSLVLVFPYLASSKSLLAWLAFLTTQTGMQAKKTDWPSYDISTWLPGKKAGEK